MKQFPKAMYIVRKEEDDAEWFLASDTMSDLGIELGEKARIGLYKLEGFYDAEGTITTSKLKK